LGHAIARSEEPEAPGTAALSVDRGAWGGLGIELAVAAVGLAIDASPAAGAGGEGACIGGACSEAVDGPIAAGDGLESGDELTARVLISAAGFGASLAAAPSPRAAD
jgi:hypothetical protein